MKLKKHGEKIQDRVSQRIQNETEARRDDARQRVAQRVQYETESETAPIIFYLYLIKS